MTAPASALAALSDAAATASTRGKKTELGQDDFLRLMVSQLKNQNPLKPLENTEFLAQLAQFSVVSGIQNMQSSFSQLAQSLQANQALQGSALIGREALVPGDQLHLADGDGADIAFDLPQGSRAVTVEISDAAGQPVRRIALDALDGGLQRLHWDGDTDDGARAAAGAYSVQVRAEQNLQTVALAPLVSARIHSVSLGGTSGLVLNLDGLGSTALSQVREIQ